MSAAARFVRALEELGGLFAVFGQFLGWRADVLPAEYIDRLRHMRVRLDPVPRGEVARRLAAGLGEAGRGLAAGLAGEPCWSTVSRCAYRAQYEGRSIVVQVARPPVPDSAFRELEDGLRLLRDEEARPATAPRVRAEFREWLRLGESPPRERSYLEAIGAYRGKSYAEYPAIIPELSAGDILCWPWVEGQALSALIAQGSADAVHALAETVLEQFCLLGVVDGELDLEAVVLTGAGAPAFRRANRMIAVPPTLVRTTLKYISAVLAEHDQAAAQALAKLACGNSSPGVESQLLEALSGLQPELKINLAYPRSVATFEGNWRAVSRIGIDAPLFLDCVHRNLVAVGYWNAETAGVGADVLAQAQWPVLGRLLRTRAGELATREAAAEWMIGSGLLFFEGLRQMSGFADALRDGELSVHVDSAAMADEDGVKSNRAVRAGILLAMLLVMFLVCLRWGMAASGPLATVLAGLAAVAAVLLFFTVARMG